MSAFSIGDFSRITGLTVKTLRLYHEKGLLIPSWIDPSSGYRYYDSRCVERARTISYLRELEFSLSDIKEILDRYDEDSEVVDFLEKQRVSIQSKITKLGEIARSLDDIIKFEMEAKAMLQNTDLEIKEKELEPILVAGLRWKGKYAETGKAFQKLGRFAGRYSSGKPLNLYYDGEYKEEDADIESCFPVNKPIETQGISSHILPGGKCVTLIHKGPYEHLSRSYERIYGYVTRKKYRVLLPIREVYVKGPGMLFKGNPKNYLTEIQLLVSDQKEQAHEKSES